MKKNLFLITEEEKNRILGMHINATKSQYLSEQAAPVTTDTTTVAPPSATTPAAESQVLTANDRDYAYKKEGDKYFFKLQPNPASASAQNYQKQGKFVNWTEAKGKGLEAIQKLNFKSEKMDTLAAKDTKVTAAPAQTIATTKVDTAPVKPLATGGGSQAAGQQVTAQTSPQIAQDLKSAAQIRQEFRQGKRDLRKLQRERDKLYNTYNKLSGKMDKATDDSYLDAISKLDQLISQK
jgi:predicted secreted protein